MPHRIRRGPIALRRLAAGLLAVALLGGCADFPDTGRREFREKPEVGANAGPQPEVPEPMVPLPGEPGQPPGPQGPQRQPPPPEGCTDFDPVVVATCLDPVSAVAVLPGGEAAVVAERATGRVLRVERGQPSTVIATLPVDPAGGGLLGLALSPSYAEDELLYVYLATPADTRVVRVVPGDAPKPVLTGIPRAASGNTGALALDGQGALLVATGDPAGAAVPRSLAGKVLRIDPFGAPAPGNTDPTSPVIAAGLRSPRGLCTDPVTGNTYVTDRDGARDLLFRVRPGQPLGAAVWTWPGRPGVTGCAAAPGVLAVTLTDAAGLFVLRTTPEGAFTGQPRTVLQRAYGRLTAATLGPDGLVWMGTANKAGGTPVSSDDRVVRIPPPTGGGSGID